MNTPRLHALAQTIANLDYGTDEGTFNMGRTAHDCGTAACIAGWAVHLFGDNPEPVVEGNSHVCMQEAKHLLDLDHGVANDLFIPEFYEDEYCEYPVALCDARPHEEGYISPERAARVLHHLANTGQLDWNIT